MRRTPLHPQWLLGSTVETGRWVASECTGRVLDIGCADRWVERWLTHDGEYIGLDYPATGRTLYDARPHIFADASELPLPDASVDTVVLLEVLEHLRKPIEALREIARVLRTGGRLVLTMPFLYPIHDAPHDYQRLTLHGLLRDLESVGLRVDSAIPRLGSSETAGLIACLAMGGMAAVALEKRSVACLLIPVVAVMIPVVNVSAWMLAKLMPSWDAVTVGYRIRATCL